MKKLFVSTAIAFVLLMIITRIGSASFLRRETHGNFFTTSTTIHSETQDKFNTIIDLSSTVTYTGTLESTSTLQGTLIVHGDDSAGFRGLEIFTGSVNGIPGRLTFKLEGSSDHRRRRFGRC